MLKEKIKYGIVGFSRNQFDKTSAYKILAELFSSVKAKHSDKEVEIVSGYTNSGVPKIAYELADKFGFTTVGFSAKQALNVRSGVYPVQKVILKGDRFGDESEDFVKYIDGLIRIGGGPQSRRETEMFKRLHKGDRLANLIKEYEVDWYGDKPKLEENKLGIEGLRIIDDFLTQEYHDELISKIDKANWSNELSRRVQHYGYKYDYKARSINSSMKVGGLPDWVNPLIEKMLQEELIDTRPDQMIINEYQPGQGISNHVDCEPCFGDKIISVSLGSTAIMNFKNKRTKELHSLVLNPKGILLLSGESRYEWMHGISGRKSDMINKERVPRERRISLTFRKVKLEA